MSNVCPNKDAAVLEMALYGDDFTCLAQGKSSHHYIRVCRTWQYAEAICRLQSVHKAYMMLQFGMVIVQTMDTQLVGCQH